ncbi:MAG: hypothetical protein J6R77_00405 [Clostridia bacterium]|nr:hypothetical protein [Clostridia bacterium]
MKDWVKRLGLLLLAVFLIVYVGYQVFQVLYSNVTVETVSAYSVYDTVETEAIAIRQETAVDATVGDQYLFYTLKNGDRVSKGGIIGKLYTNEEAAGFQQQLELLDEDIAQLESAEALASNNYASLEAIDQQLAAKIKALAVQTNGRDTQTLRDLHTQLLTLMNKRQIIVGAVEGFADKLEQLRNQRQALAAKVTPTTGEIRSPLSGYFIDRADGFESYFPKTEEEIARLTPAEVKKAMGEKPTVSTQCVGKVASDFNWYITCVIDSERAAALEVGKELLVRFPFVSDENIKTTILAINHSTSEGTAVVLKCNQMSEALAEIRVQPIQLLLKEYTGLRLPDKALQFNEENRAGAYVRMGTTITFRYVDVLYHNEKDGYSICAIPDVNDRTYVQIYDDVIVEGKNLYDGKVVQS